VSGHVDPPQAVPLDRLLRPRSVALVGVSSEPGSIGGAVLANLERFGYRGDIHLVSRSAREIGGRRCAGATDEFPEGIDVAVLAVPRAATAEALAACARRKVGAAIAFAAGFAEVGGAGKTEQDALAGIARDSGIALCGPNCMGIVNFVDGVSLTFEPVAPQPLAAERAVGLVAQSGAMASIMRLALSAKGIGISYTVSTGNEAALGVEDFIAFLLDDARTSVIALFAEQFRRPRLFLALAAKARERGKPIVLMHPGRSVRAHAASRSHTGALAGDHAVIAALVRHEAVILVDTIEELIDTAEMLARFPRPPTRGAAILTNSGAFKGVALDFCEAIGLDLPEPAGATAAALREVLPPFAAVENPLDFTAQAIKDVALPARAAAPLLADPAYGTLMLATMIGPPQLAMQRANVLSPVLATADKPVVVVGFGDESPCPAEFADAFRGKGICFYRSPERALRAIAHVTSYGRALAARREESAVEPAAVAAPSLPSPASGGGQGSGPGGGTEFRAKAFLSALGIPVPWGALARDLAEAKKIAARIGYPVVLKAQARELAHKSDAGGVILAIADDQALATAWERLAANVRRSRPDLKLEGILVEKEAARGVEMLVGARRDPDWGPVLMVGLGGIWVETLRDVRLLAPDLDGARIVAEIGRLRGADLLTGARGAAPADIEALAAVVARLGALMRAEPAIAEIEVNPLVVYPKGRGVIALDALLVADERVAPAEIETV